MYYTQIIDKYQELTDGQFIRKIFEVITKNISISDKIVDRIMIKPVMYSTEILEIREDLSHFISVLDEILTNRGNDNYTIEKAEMFSKEMYHFIEEQYENSNRIHGIFLQINKHVLNEFTEVIEEMKSGGSNCL